MTELRDIEADLSRFRARVLVVGLVILLAFSMVAARLVYLQVVRHEDLAEQAPCFTGGGAHELARRMLIIVSP